MYAPPSTWRRRIQFGRSHQLTGSFASTWSTSRRGRRPAAILPPTSPFYLYGPYKREGFATAPSNQAFDRSLRDRNPNWGLRDLEAVAAIAQSVGFSAPVI